MSAPNISITEVRLKEETKWCMCQEVSWWFLRKQEP
jgi:hypothetical protein